jgi:hypothetical protein
MICGEESAQIYVTLDMLRYIGKLEQLQSQADNPPIVFPSVLILMFKVI